MENISSLVAFVLIPLAIFLFAVIFIAKRYKRCPSNKILVVYGKVGGDKTAKCIHGGGVFIIPLIQDYAYMSLEPISLDIDLKGALSKENIRVHVPSTFTVGISTNPEVMANAAERLLGLDARSVNQQAAEIIFGQFRQAIASMTIEEINQHRDKLLGLVHTNVGTELRKIGLEVINVNVRDLSDDAGYIKAIGQNAAATAINKAKIEVAEQEKLGQIGVATADKERTITVAEQNTASKTGETKAITSQRVDIAKLEAEAVQGENNSKAAIAQTNADLQVKRAEALQRGEVAQAEATTAVFEAQKKQEVAKLEKEQLAQQEIDKKKIEIEASAEGERIRLVARAKADAIIMEKEAEARGIEAVLKAKADGYENLIKVAGGNAPTLLTIEQLPELVKAQVEAIKNIKIDKITVFDAPGANGDSSLSHLMRGFTKSLPQLHDIAKNAGLDLPEFLGSVKEKND